jgi:acetyl-CoA synthetase
MPTTVIHKDPATVAGANLGDYEAERTTFSWSDAAAPFGFPDRAGLNIAYEAVTRHATGPHRTRVALRCLARDGTCTEVTYEELEARSNRFANVVRGLGLGEGDVIALLLPRSQDLYVAVLGALKNGCVVTTLFPAFGPEPIRQRLALADARVLVTTERFYGRKVARLRDELPALAHVLLVDGSSTAVQTATSDLASQLDAASDQFDVVATSPDTLALLHFTSGTTGAPKGAMHVHEAVVAHHVTARFALDLRADDVFWCTADPGWVTGMSYGVVAPLTLGATVLVDEGDFDAERWYRTLQDQRVTVWYTAPTALRMLVRAGSDMAQRFDLGALRFIASVGEPLNAEVVRWTDEVLGCPAHDNWWQTETGGIMVANFASVDIMPGSMGVPMPGVDVAILARDAERDGAPLIRDGAPVVAPPGDEGHLAIRRGWPSMFRGYLNEPARYAAAFVGDWYVSGDLARREADGHVWFVGRSDDVIKSAGHLIGPFEVESTLIEHPAVVEAGVIGTPDPVAGEVVKAFVSLADGVVPDDELRSELLGFARSRLGAAVAPREIEFDQHLPHTRSGKIMRRLLKARELGLVEGDLSTLETS